MCYKGIIMCFGERKKIKQQICEFQNNIDKLLDKYNCELVYFQYHGKIFGNIKLKIKHGEKEVYFVTDRGEIYYNGCFMCESDYILTEKKTTPEKLLELVELKLIELTSV